ncbi:efflux RND transporter periplasmic adaptor subunit [Puniceibacterium sp. IMCC21224]|uniref:efflux RND transporter periplasmic adaptor subunit n=1 Tax=Puniceibacterium sp. IMCC21224 TaxID=1618204 RepID=UPI001E3438B1|nr:efflux RND transporter periplasmic adaptor subunit [Puniceibacterium sp. IMCC21224]
MLKQIILGLIVIAGTIAVWVTYVPSAAGWLDRVGLLDALGIDMAEAAQSDGATQQRGGGGATQVIAVAVTQGVLNDRITAVGDGRALRSVTVRPKVTGTITRIGFDAGAHVTEGAVMMALDDEAEQIALERARLMQVDAQEDVDRLSALGNSGAVTAVRIREAQLALRTAELELRQAEFDLDRREIRAPISGWIGILEVDEGDRVSAQDALAVITDRSQILIDFHVPERVIGQITPGMTVTLAPLANRSQTMEGEISALDNIVDRASRTLRIQARIANANDRLRAGMAFSVLLRFAGESYPSINPLSVQWSSDGSYVWAVRDGKAVRVPIVIRQRNSDSVLVEGALALGDLVVTEGVQSLRPGTEVSVAGQDAPEGASAAVTDRRNG